MIRTISFAVGSVFLLWVAFVVLIAGGFWHPPGTWDFRQTGVLGDSFGIVSAVMATAAAIFTFQTMVTERRQANLRDKADRHREAEQTFFQLMGLRNEVIGGISVTSGLSRLNGHEALAHMAKRLVREIEGRSGPPAETAYCRLYDKWRDQLGHYFRFTYHIAVFADAEFDAGQNYKYVRWLRAQMTNSEQTLLALNCLYGEGRKRFKGLVEFHALLHNIHPTERERLALDLLFEPSAFDLPPPIVPVPGWWERTVEGIKDVLSQWLTQLRGIAPLRR